MELSLPDELLLLCASPRTGVIQCEKYFTRVLAGGVLAELRLRGAAVIEGDWITEVRTMTIGDPVADEVLDKIVRHVQLGWPGARQTRLIGLPTDYEGTAGLAGAGVWARRLARAGATVRAAGADVVARTDLTQWLGLPYFSDLEQRYLHALEGRGLLTADRRRVLGVVPRTTWNSVSRDHARRVLARIDPEVRPHAYGRPAVPPSDRTVDLLALAHVGNLTGVLYPADEDPATHAYIRRLAAAHPLAPIAEEFMRLDAIPSSD